MDSEAAAIGFSALRSFAPERSLNLASSMQRAIYYEGKSLSDPTNYREIAIAHNLDPGTVVARFADVATTKDAQADFMRFSSLVSKATLHYFCKEVMNILGLMEVL